MIRHGGEVLDALLCEDCPVFDLIVLDLHLPGLSGLEILRELRRHGKTRYAPLVMLSAVETDREVAQCLEEGAGSCVLKPVDPHLYIERVGLMVRYWIEVHHRPRLTLHRSEPTPSRRESVIRFAAVEERTRQAS